jgi:hypothetical protein
MDIDKLIGYLEEERALGAKTVTLWGKATLTADEIGCNSVVMTTEPQI